MKVMIIGGVAGGAACATRLRRLDENLDITIVERGEYLSFANCGLPYYVGDVINNRNSLFVATAALFKQRFNINVLNKTNAIKIDREKKEVLLDAGNGIFSQKYDKLILSPGATPFVPECARGKKGVFTIRNVPDADNVLSYIKNKQVSHAVVVGGGFIGLEMAENLRHKGLDVDLVEGVSQVMAPLDQDMAQYLHKELNDNGIRVHLNTMLDDIVNEDDKVILKTKCGKEIRTDLVILSIGIKPESELAKDCGLELSDKGYIVVDEHMQTSDKDIYALGDASYIKEPILGNRASVALAGPATKQARVVCSNVLGGNDSYEGAMGGSIAKIFSLQSSSIGYNAKTLSKTDIDFEEIYLHSPSHASYYPQSNMIHFKLIYDKKSRRLLGAQAIGADGCDKRIEIVSSYLSMKGTIDDLAFHEQIYAPPYGSAKDVVNFAGFVAQNIEDGLFEQVKVCDLDKFNKDECIFLDVRTAMEVDTMKLDNFVNIDLNMLRDNLDKLDKNKTILVTCAIGLRGYIACRILKEHGFNHVYNIAGGAASMKIHDYKVKA